MSPDSQTKRGQLAGHRSAWGLIRPSWIEGRQSQSQVTEREMDQRGQLPGLGEMIGYVGPWLG
jgi:hypothetical protein